MTRALNQAIGRAIRHKDDYGCVFLLDYRFENHIKDLSRWCRDFVKNPPAFEQMIYDVKQFYENNRLTDLNRQLGVSSDNQAIRLDQNEKNYLNTSNKRTHETKDDKRKLAKKQHNHIAIEYDSQPNNSKNNFSKPILPLSGNYFDISIVNDDRFF